MFHLLQHRAADGTRSVIAANADGAQVIRRFTNVRELALEAILQDVSLAALVEQHRTDNTIDIAAEHAAGRIIAPIDHSDPAHMLLSGTGLTHLGSAEGRDKMHRAAAQGEQLTDSMRIFLEGVEGGKPTAGESGVQPEWFYKGDGSSIVDPGTPLVSPAFALDGSEEPELAGIYVIGPDAAPYRIGFCLANEFSDHVTERHNYLWLAHSKLRCASLGPEILVGGAPLDIRGASRIVRDGVTIWEKPFLTGETNMSHSIANLEAHHFKYALFRRPGDVHVHFFGTATLSFSDGVTTRDGDLFEIEAPPFTLPLRNPLAIAAAESVTVNSL
jgi:hypothetical protein